MDLDEVKMAYKSYRLRLQRLFESSKEANGVPCCTEESIQLTVPDTCWCLRCVEYYNHCLATYNSKALNLVGGLFTKYIMYQCKQDPSHLFYVSSVRKHKFQKQYKIHDYTCPDCKQTQRDNERKVAAEQEERKMREQADRQRELFE